MTPPDLLQVAKDYLRALEEGATGERLAAFFTSDVLQEELPNRIAPNGALRNLEQLLEGAERGQVIMRQQRFELLSAIAQGSSMALEVQWTGSLRAPVTGLPSTLRARFAVFLEFRGDKIARQRNYDCFEPW